MPIMNRLNQYHLCRGGFWNYHRRVPKEYRDLDPRGTIRTALNRDSLQIAKAHRDALAKADEKLWHALQAELPSALDAYEAARERAMALGFIYIPAEELAAQATMDEILSRVKKIETSSPIVTVQADAMLGRPCHVYASFKTLL